MMIYKLVEIYIKNLIRKKSVVFLISILTIYNFYICISSIIMYNSHYYILDSNTYCIVGFFLLATLLGHSISTEDDKSQFNDIILSIYKGYKYNFLTKLISSILILTILISFNVLVIYVAFAIKGSNLTIYIDLFKYMVLYWYLPTIIFFMIGAIIGEKIKGKISYIFLLGIVFVLSNLNNYIFGFIQHFTEIDILSLSWYLTLGNFEPGVILYNGFYGYHNRLYDLSKVILILSIVCMIMILVYKKYMKSKVKFVSSTVLVLLSLSCISNLYSNRQRINEIANIDAPYGNKLEKYYSINSNTVLNNEDILFSNYDIERCSIEIVPENKFEFDVEMDIRVNENTKNLSFMLLHTLEIKTIKESDGTDIQFDSKNDLVNINLNKTLNKNEKITINLKYDGYLPSDYYIENDLIYLTSKLPIIPTNIFIDPIQQLDYFGYEANNFSANTKYSIKVNSKNIAYSNLESKDFNLFQGEDTGFILLLNDRYESNTYEGIEYFYPKAYKSNYKEIEASINYIKKGIEYIDKLTDDDKLSKLQKIFINTSQYNYGTSVEIYENSIVINTRIAFDFILYEDDIFIALIDELININENNITYEK
ncbi:MAG: hypothetical protein ACRCX2_27440, partial [Paraclostridium sp.]